MRNVLQFVLLIIILSGFYYLAINDAWVEIVILLLGSVVLGEKMK
jgi:hypothetical protein